MIPQQKFKMTPQEKSKIEQALSSPNPTRDISATCRKIVMDRIDRMNHPDRELRFLVKGIIEASDFGCEIKVNETRIPGSTTVSTPKVKRAVALGLLGLAALIGAIVSEKEGMRSIYGIVAAAGAFMAGNSLATRKTIVSERAEMSLVAVTTADMIASRIDKFTNSLVALFDYRQLEGTHKEFLRWLQSQYSDSSDTSFKENISRLLKKFGYRMGEYTDATIEAFDISEANIAAPLTSVYALYNSEGQAILKGVYVIPLKK